MRSENVVDLLHIESDPLCHRLRGSLLQQLWGDFQVTLNRLRWTQVDNFQVDNLQVDNFQVDNLQVDNFQVTLNRLRWTMLVEEIKRSDNRSVCLARGELWWRHGPINQVEGQVVELSERWPPPHYQISQISNIKYAHP